MRHRLRVAGAMVGMLGAWTLTSGAAVLPHGMQGGEVQVAVTYKGKGLVDAEHEIRVFLFDHPAPGESSVPLAMQPITKNGGSVTFKGVTADPVYISVVYDEASNYEGNAPPPPGAPIGSYARAGKPVAVKPGPDAKVAVTFDDARRWGK